MFDTLDYYFSTKKGEEFNVRATQRMETIEGETHYYDYQWAILWGHHIVLSGNSSGGSMQVKMEDLVAIAVRCRFQVKSFEDELERP